MRRRDFHYPLPEALIAQYPASKRSASRLLVLDPVGGQLRDSRFNRLPDLLDPGDLLVFNDTRVIPARFFARKETGGAVEVLVERMLDETRLLAQLRASRSPQPGQHLVLEDGSRIGVIGRRQDLFELRSPDRVSWGELLEAVGHVPLPPYIRRPDEELDRRRYQTVYASRHGAVAAPTAGLHFDDALLARLKKRGINSAFLTLHVGAGTFQPVRAERVKDHRVHGEYLEVSGELCERVADTRASGSRVIAVGTTSVRGLETAAAGGRLEPYRGETDLFIYPGYHFRVVDALITNFHLPESSLLMLVCAFGGYASVMSAYAHAIEEQYRFYSYGDAMFITARGRQMDLLG